MKENSPQQIFPVDSATSRDILVTFVSSTHSTHSMDGAAAGSESLTLFCSCGQNVRFTSSDVQAVGWKFGEVVDRLKKLCQIGRPLRKENTKDG